MSRNAFQACEAEYNENEAMREHAQYERDQMKKVESMKTVTAKVNAYVTNDFTTIEELYQGKPEDVINALKFYLHSGTPESWVLAGTAEITLTLNDPDDLITHKVGALKAELRKTQADAEVRCNVLREQINNLLALEYKP